MKRLYILLSLLIAAAMLLGACAQATPAPEEPAAEQPAQEQPAAPEAKPFEGQTLRLLTWEGYVPDEVKDAFESETGATVEITYISDNGELISKLRATGGEGWDLASPSVDNIAVAQDLYGIYQAIDTSRISNFANAIDSLDSRVADYTKLDDGGRLSIPFTWGTSGLMYNTAKVDEEINSYLQLCDPKYAGRVTMRYRYPAFMGMAYGMGYDPFALILEGKTDEYKDMMQAVYDKLVECKPNVKAYWTTRQENLDLFLSDEVFVGMGWDGTGWLLSNEKPEIKFVAPKEGALGWVDTFTLPAGAEAIDLAYAWIEYNYQPEIAGKIIAGGGFLSAIEGAVDQLDAAQAALVNESFPPEAIDNINWYAPQTADIDEINGNFVEKLRAAVEQ